MVTRGDLSPMSASQNLFIGTKKVELFFVSKFCFSRQTFSSSSNKMSKFKVAQ